MNDQNKKILKLKKSVYRQKTEPLTQENPEWEWGDVMEKKKIIRNGAGL